MIDCVLKFYARPHGMNASKVVDRVTFTSSDKTAAIAQARELFEIRRDPDKFAMLFVVNGDLMWISE